MTGSSSLLDLDSSANTSQDRPSSGNRPAPEFARSTSDPMLGSGSPGKQPPQLLHQQSKPSPLRQGTPVMQSDPFQAPPQTNSPRSPASPRQTLQPGSPRAHTSPRAPTSPVQVVQPGSPRGPTSPVQSAYTSPPRAPTSPGADHQNSPRAPPNVAQNVTGSPRTYSKPIYTGSPRLSGGSQQTPPSSPGRLVKPMQTGSLIADTNQPPVTKSPVPAPAQMAPPFSDEGHSRVVSGPPGDSSTRPQFSPTPDHPARQSLDSSVQLNTDPREFQKFGGFSPDFSRKPGVPSEASQTTSVNHDLPQSPVSQVSKTDFPSVASSVQGQSPRLPALATNLSGPLMQNPSQPGTPAQSQASHTPPTQHQIPPSQQQLQQQEEQLQNQQSPPPQQMQLQQQQRHFQQPQPPQQQQQRQSQQQPPLLQQQSSPHLQQQQSFEPRMSIGQQPPQQQRQQGPHPGGYQIAPGTQQPPGLAIPHSTVQAFPGQSSQVSPRPSFQMSNSMPPQGYARNNMPPPGQPQPLMVGPPRTESPGSKWTGLRNRISSQASNLGSQPPAQGKPSGDGKSSTSKLLSAFKRSSKQPEPRQQGQMHPMNMQPGVQPYQQGPPRMQQSAQQQQQQFMHPQQQFPQQQQQQQPPPQANAQFPQRQQSPPMTSPVSGPHPFLTSRSNSAALGQPPQPPNGQPVNGLRQAPPPIVQDPLRQQRPAQQRRNEPHYDQVPIPRGYQAVRGEGVAVPSQYNVGRPMHHAYSPQSMNMAQFPPQQLQPQPGNPGMLRQASSPQILQQQQMMPVMGGGRSPDGRSPDGPLARGPPQSQPGQNSPPMGGSSFQVNPQIRSDAPRFVSDGSQPDNSRMNMGPRSVSSPLQTPGSVTGNHQTGPSPRHQDPLRSHPSKQNLVAPEPSPQVDSSRASSDGAPPSSGPREQQARESGVMLVQPDNAPEVEEPRAISISPPVENNIRAMSPISNLNTQPSPPVESQNRTVSPYPNLHVQSPPPTESSNRAVSPYPSVNSQIPPPVVVGETTDRGKTASPESLHTAPAQIVQQNSGVSREGSRTPEPEIKEGAAVRSPAQQEDAHAELDDTSEAHQRKLRIDSQEEKIHYDPNADSDGEVPPQMSATSYPGQEWNPYGMPEFGEWQE